MYTVTDGRQGDADMKAPKVPFGADHVGTKRLEQLYDIVSGQPGLRT